MPDEIIEVSENSWFAWSKHVLMELEKNAECIASMKRDITSIKEEVAALKVKAQIWGLIGGAIPATVGIGIALLIWIVKKP